MKRTHYLLVAVLFTATVFGQEKNQINLTHALGHSNLLKNGWYTVDQPRSGASDLSIDFLRDSCFFTVGVGLVGQQDNPYAYYSDGPNGHDPFYHYVGYVNIFARVGYNFWQKNDIRAHIAAGPFLGIIYDQVRYTFHDENTLTAITNHRLFKSDLLFGATVELGLSYNIWKGVQLGCVLGGSSQLIPFEGLFDKNEPLLHMWSTGLKAGYAF